MCSINNTASPVDFLDKYVASASLSPSCTFFFSTVTGFDLWGAVVATGVVCTFYCTLVCEELHFSFCSTTYFAKLNTLLWCAGNWVIPTYSPTPPSQVQLCNK